MKIWKIEHVNKSSEGVKIAIALSSNESKGIILKPGEFVLAQEQPTASLDSQTRRGYVKVESFDNSILHLNLGEAYKIADLLKENETAIKAQEEPFLSKLQEAEKDASDYINDKKEE